MRFVAMGGEALVEGLSLLGFETWPDATGADVELVLGDLLREKGTALVFLEHALVREGGESLARVRREGGRIVVTEVPPLHAPQDYEPPVETLVRRVLGPRALDEQP